MREFARQDIALASLDRRSALISCLWPPQPCLHHNHIPPTCSLFTRARLSQACQNVRCAAAAPIVHTRPVSTECC